MIEFHTPPHPEYRDLWRQTVAPGLRGVALDTCDRTELYTGDGEAPPEVARHLFSVAAGLRSPLLGETAILGQVRQAYLLAAREGRATPGLHLLFQKALHTGKRVRQETALSRGAVSHALGVLEILKGELGDLQNKTFVLLGVNKISQDLIAYLRRSGAQALLLGNRSLDRAQDLARVTGAQAFALDHLREILPQADVVISATRAPHPVVRPLHWPRDNQPRWVFDLAFPPDIDPEVAQSPGVRYFDLKRVEALVDQRLDQRREEALKAQALVEEELQGYFQTMTRRLQWKTRPAS